MAKKETAKKSEKDKKEAKPSKKTIRETQAIVDTVESVASSIVPVDEEKATEKVDKKAEKATAKDKKATKEEEPAKIKDAYSDEVFEIKSGEVSFVNGDIVIPEGYTVQRIKETIFLFSTKDNEGNPVTEEIDLNLNAGLFESQLKQYKQGLGIQNTPISQSSVNAVPNAIAAPTQYTATSAMQDYANTIHKGILDTPVVKMGRKINASYVQDMLKKESKQYQFELKGDPHNGFYIEMAGHGNIVRIPNDEKLFLPIQ